MLPRSQRYPVRTFVNGATKLSVLLANKLELEKQLGVDLIYCNETHQSVVFVQYKMFAGADGADGYRPNEQLTEEIRRMDALAATFAAVPPMCRVMATGLHLTPSTSSSAVSSSPTRTMAMFQAITCH